MGFSSFGGLGVQGLGQTGSGFEGFRASAVEWSRAEVSGPRDRRV